MSRRRMQEELKVQEMKLQMKSEEYEKRDKIVNDEGFNVKLPKLVITNLMVRFWTGSIFGTSLRERLTRLRLIL